MKYWIFLYRSWGVCRLCHWRITKHFLTGEASLRGHRFSYAFPLCSRCFDTENAPDEVKARVVVQIERCAP